MDELKELKSELEWYRAYGSYVNVYFPNVCAEASEYADQENQSEK